MAIVFAIYGFVDLILVLAAKVINERVKPIFHAMGARKNWDRAQHRQKADERTYELEGPIMLISKISSKGRVTIPAELRERFGMKKGTRIDWTKDGPHLVLTPVKRPRKKS